MRAGPGACSVTGVGWYTGWVGVTSHGSTVVGGVDLVGGRAPRRVRVCLLLAAAGEKNCGEEQSGNRREETDESHVMSTRGRRLTATLATIAPTRRTTRMTGRRSLPE